MKIKDILAIRRKDLGLTQAEIAKACSVSEATVSRWEKGQIADIKQSKILSLSEILQISPALIIGHTETDAYGPLTRSFMEVPLYDSYLFDGTVDMIYEPGADTVAAPYVE